MFVLALYHLAGSASWLLMMLLAFAAMLVVGGLVGLVAMFIAGIAKNRPWLSFTALGLGLLGMLGVGLFVALAVPAYQAAQSRIHGERAEIQFSEPHTHIEWREGPIEWHGEGNDTPAFWRRSLVPPIVIFIGLGALVFAIAKRCKSGRSCSGGFLTWARMAVITVAVLGMLAYASVRSVQRAAQRASVERLAHLTEEATLHAEQARRQAEAVRRQAAEPGEQAKHQIEQIHNPQVSIEALEEEFIAPKIPLPPTAPESPQQSSGAAVSGDVKEKDANLEASEEQAPDDGSDEETRPAPEENAEESAPAETAPEEPATGEASPEESSEPAGDERDVDEPPATESWSEEASSEESEEAPPTKPEEPQQVSANTDQSEPGGDESAAATKAAIVKVESDGPSTAVTIESPSATITNTAAEATSAVKEMATSMTAFAQAINRAVDEYARAAAKAAETDVSESGAVSASASTWGDQANVRRVVVSNGQAANNVAISSAGADAWSAEEPKPSWVDDPRNRIGDVQRQVIATDEYATVEECNQAADILLMLTAYDHLMPMVGISLANYAERPSLEFRNGTVLANGEVIAVNGQFTDHRLGTLASMGINSDFIRREIIAQDANEGQRIFVETVDRSFGPMKKLYAQAEFTPAVDDHLRRRWNDYRRSERFGVVGVGAMSILGLLGTVWGLLKVDTMTKGYYTKRLFLGVPLGVLGLFGLIALAIEAL